MSLYPCQPWSVEAPVVLSKDAQNFAMQHASGEKL
jgi:hypothetical protein